MNKSFGNRGSGFGPGQGGNKDFGQRFAPARAAPATPRTKVLDAPRGVGWTGTVIAAPTPAAAEPSPASTMDSPSFSRFARLWAKGRETLDAWRASGIPVDTQRLIESRARRFARAYGLPRDSITDLKQDFYLEVWTAIEGYEEGRSTPEAFAAGVVYWYYKQLVREHYRNKGKESEHIALLDLLIDEPERFVRTYGEQRAAELRLDLASILENAPEDIRELADALMEKSPAEIAVCIGVHRGTIYRRIERLRDEFGDKFEEIR